MSSSGKIVNLVNPTFAQDAATKSYVDTATTNMATTSSVSTAISTALGSSGTQANWPTIQRGDTTNATHYLTFIDGSDIASDGSSKRALMRCDANLSYNPNTNTLTAGSFNGTATSATEAVYASRTPGRFFTINGGSSYTNDIPSDTMLWLKDQGWGYGPKITLTGYGNHTFQIGQVPSSPDCYLWNGHNGYMRFGTNGTERMRITGDGNVGIGISSPAAPLHVTTSSAQTIDGTGRFWDKNGSTGVTPQYNTGTVSNYNPDVTNVSIRCSGSIWTQGSHMWVTSDQRIKTNITSLNADKMINVFRNLRPISFDFIDSMKTNNKKHFGFIAQEVNEVLPEGISLNTDVIPNNMMKGGITKPSETDETHHFTLKPTDIDITLQYLLLTTDTPLIFDISNSYSSTNTYKFKIYCGKEWVKEHDIYIRSEYNVTDDKYTYVIGMKKEVYDIVITEPTLFVYGQYVYDLHILDTDTIYTVATAALQEVDRQQQADKARIAELEATVSTQQSLINDILERLKKVERA